DGERIEACEYDAGCRNVNALTAFADIFSGKDTLIVHLVGYRARQNGKSPKENGHNAGSAKSLRDCGDFTGNVAEDFTESACTLDSEASHDERTYHNEYSEEKVRPCHRS